MAGAGSSRKERERDLHRQLAADYERFREGYPQGRAYSLSWLERMLDEVPPAGEGTVLDVGCGTGLLHEILGRREPALHYVGVDLSSEMLEVGRRRDAGIDLREMDAEHLAFEDRSFDLVVGRSLLHHLPDPHRATGEMWRVLRPGGHLLISEPIRHVLTDLPRRILWRYSSHFDHEHTHFRPRKLRAFLEQLGADGIRSRPFGFLAYPWAFPDILPPTRRLPVAALNGLLRVDEVLARIPGIRRFSWHLILSARKPRSPCDP